MRLHAGCALALVLLLGAVLAAPSLYAQKIRLDERAAHGVSITYHQDRYFMAWAGESNRLYVIRSEDGVDWRAKIALDERSGHAPDLASDGDYLYLTWAGENTNDLYVMRSRDGVDWGNKVRLNERSDARPTITGVDGGPLLLAWKGEESNKIHVLRSRDGVDWGSKIALDEQTLNGPTLAVHDGAFYLAWTGVDNNDLYVMRSAEGVDWRAKIRLDERGRKAPSMVSFDGRLYISWQGDTQGDVYVMESLDGVDWRSKQRLDERTLKSLDLAAGHKLALTFQGDSTGDVYFLMIRDRVASPNRPPQALDDAAMTERGRAVTIDVLANDYDDDGDALAIVAVGRPVNGSAGVNADGTLSFEPNAGFVGREVFSYTIDDGQGGIAEATVQITVEEGRSTIEQELRETGRATLRGIYFDFDSATLQLESNQTLNTILSILQDNQDAEFTFEGHTSAEGADAYNMSLSQQRAEAVVAWLVERGISRSRLDARGYGESRPVADNDTEEGKALNRRVEIVERK